MGNKQGYIIHDIIRAMTTEIKRVIGVDLQEYSLEAETQEGEIVRIPVRKDVGGTGKKIPPEGTIESLIPVLERVFIDHPKILSPDSTFWTMVAKQAEHTEERAVNLLRRHSFSVRETTERVVDKTFMLSGVGGVEEEDRETFIGYAKEQIHRLYITTTEVSSAKK